MADDTKQAVDEKVDAAAPQAAETDAARDQDEGNKTDDLDALLAEFDKNTGGADDQKDAPKSDPDPNESGSDLETRLKQLEQSDEQRRQATLDADMTSAVETVRGELPADKITDGMVRGWLDERAARDERFAKAWLGRHSNPQAFKQVLTGLGREFAKTFQSDVDTRATEDQDAVTAALRGSGNTPPVDQAPNFGNKSNAEFADEVEKQFGFRPGV